MARDLHGRSLGKTLKKLMLNYSGLFLPLALLSMTVGAAGCGNMDDAGEAVASASQYTISGNVGELLKEGEALLSRGTAVLGGTEEIGRVALTNGEFS